jgi:sarcosine oxidase gamma subunit
VPKDGADAFARSVRRHLGFAAPALGRFAESQSAGGAFRLMHVGDRQFFLTSSAPSYPGSLDKVASITDQTDGWIGMVLEGERVPTVMEKLTTIDLHHSVFPAGSVARAPIEGMLGILACEDQSAGRFVLHFQRSSARSLVDHIIHAATSACGPSKSGVH